MTNKTHPKAPSLPPSVTLIYDKKPPSATGRWNELYDVTTGGGRLICSSRTPLFSAARVLLREGIASETVLELVRKGDAGWSLRGAVGKMAKLTVREGAKSGPTVVPYDGERLLALKSASKIEHLSAQAGQHSHH